MRQKIRNTNQKGFMKSVMEVKLAARLNTSVVTITLNQDSSNVNDHCSEIFNISALCFDELQMLTQTWPSKLHVIHMSITRLVNNRTGVLFVVR